MARGRYFQIAVKSGTSYVTIAQCTSQKITISAQTGDVTTKDIGKCKEITGRSWSLSTDNLICDYKNTSATGIHAATLLKNYLISGATLDIRVQYAETTTTDATDENEGNNDSPVTLISGTVRVTNFQATFPNKENSSYTAEFTGLGAPTVQP